MAMTCHLTFMTLGALLMEHLL